MFVVSWKNCRMFLFLWKFVIPLIGHCSIQTSRSWGLKHIKGAPKKPKKSDPDLSFTSNNLAQAMLGSALAWLRLS